MPTPKSQIKVIAKHGKTEIVYENNLDATEYYMFELSRAALRDVGKFARKAFKTAYYSHFKKHSGEGGKAVSYKVYSNKDTIYPRVEIGLPKSYRGKEVRGFYAYFQEFGSSKTKKLGLLTHAIEDNIAEIIKIESQYLSGLSDEADRLESLIDENEYEGGENDE